MQYMHSQKKLACTVNISTIYERSLIKFEMLINDNLTETMARQILGFMFLVYAWTEQVGTTNISNINEQIFLKF